jgi:hypothetical protein
METIEERDAKDALRILIDFFKNETETSINNGKLTLTYEPFITKLTAYRDEFLH